MSEFDLGQYLTDDERAALSVDRQTTVARTLGLQIRKLQLYGAAPDHINDDLANMRTKFRDLSTETIEKIQKNLFDHVAYLVEDQATQSQISASFEATPSLMVVKPIEIESTPTPNIEGAAGIEQDVLVQENHKEPELNTIKPISIPIEIPEIEYDDRRPKNLPVALNNLFNGVLTYEERAALLDLDMQQRTALLKAFHETMTTKSRKPKYAPVHTDRLDKLLNGMPIAQVAELEGQTTGAITTAFKNTVHDILRSNRPEFIRTYMSYLDGEEIPRIEEQLDTENEKDLSHVAEKIAKQKQEIPRPEGLHPLINNLFSKFLSYEQREAVAKFNPAQVNELVTLFDHIYEDNAVRIEEKTRHIGRIESLMNGVALRDVATREGVKQIVIIQGFSKLLPGIFAPHQDRIVERLKAICANDVQVDASTTDINGRGKITDFNVAINEDKDIVPPQAGAVNEIVEEKQELLVGLMASVYKTNDPQALKGIKELLSLGNGVISSSEDSIEAARYLARLVQAKGINLSLEIANPHGRRVIERLLNGIQQGEDRQWSTLSEIVEGTPEGLRQAKIVATQKGLEKLIGKLEGSAAPRIDAREQQISNLRNELHKYVELSVDLTHQIIDRAQGDDNEYSSDLGKGLVQLHRVAAGVGLDDNELKIIRMFTTPRMGEQPLRVKEIRDEISKLQSKYINDEYVPSMLLRSFDKIVTQRSN